MQTTQNVTENKEAKADSAAKPADPDDIYAKLDWETNPPINGFYEMMMELTPERRKELRELARQHNEKHENRTVATITPEVHVNNPGRRKHSRKQSPHLLLPMLHRKRWLLPFSRHRTGKAEGGSRGPYAACLPSHAGDAPARRLAGG